MIKKKVRFNKSQALCLFFPPRHEEIPQLKQPQTKVETPLFSSKSFKFLIEFIKTENPLFTMC